MSSMNPIYKEDAHHQTKINSLNQSHTTISIFPDGIGSITADGTEIPHGHKFDADKPRFELLPIEGERMLAGIMTGGARKYNENNWTGLNASRILGAAKRHLNHYLAGQDFDSDSGQHHLGHFLANLVMVHHIVHFFPQQDDRIIDLKGKAESIEKTNDIHIYRLSRSDMGISQYTLLPPDSMEAAAIYLTDLAKNNGDHWWLNDSSGFTVKTYIEIILDNYFKFSNRETNDLGSAIANTMIIIELMIRGLLIDDRIFNYVER